MNKQHHMIKRIGAAGGATLLAALVLSGCQGAPRADAPSATSVGAALMAQKTCHPAKKCPAPTTTTTAPAPAPTTTTTAPAPTTTTTAPAPTTTTTTTAPAPTTTTTAPVPTTSSVPGQVCTNPYYKTSDANGGVSDGGYYVHNNLWNAAKYPGTTGSTEVCSYHSWNHTAYASNASGTGEVKTYPNVHKDYSGRTINSFTQLTSTFAQVSPNSGIYNVAYDMWLNGVPNDEVMVWTENHKQYPAGSKFTTVTISGVSWDVYATSGNGYIAFVPSGGKVLTSGTVDLKAMLQWLVAQGRLPATSTVDQVGYGVEVVDTGGSKATWNFTDFSITDR
ncbi:MAG: GH12 family glycosyl hydrolase domain-containing protein [Intrasporangium sp.]|uniref:GH12 family glycosyl hydrolase domain-containing protein n=1 Tax=Intrasporangium sp. TaxID=1925024 RepID=UPI003F81EA67